MAANSNNRQNLILGIIFVILGAVLAVTMTMNLIKTSGTSEAFDSLTVDTIKEGMLVEGDIAYNYGNYETLYSETSSGYKETKGQYYLIQLADGQFIGFYTSEAKLIGELNYQEDEYYEYFTGNSEVEPRKLHFKGTVKNMDLEDAKIFRNYLQEGLGFNSDVVGDMSVCVFIENHDNSAATPIMLGLGVVLVIVGAVFVLRFILNRNKA